VIIDTGECEELARHFCWVVLICGLSEMTR
jgi:hypothetical protein